MKRFVFGAMSAVLLLLAWGEVASAESFGITIIKQTIPPGDPQKFDFTGDLGDFQLADGENTYFQDSDLPDALAVTVKENVPSGWQVSNIVCEDDLGSLVYEYDFGSAQVTIPGYGGVTIQCTFTNRKLGLIIVEKQAVPDGSSESFAFSGDAAGTISDGQQIVVSGLAPGTYTSQETVPAGWNLTSIECDDDDSSGDLATRTATFRLEAGETVKCTFTDSAICPPGLQPILISGQTNVQADTGGETGPDPSDGFFTFCYDPVNVCYVVIGNGELEGASTFESSPTATGFEFNGTPECGTQENLFYDSTVTVTTGNSATRNSRTARGPQGFSGPFNSLTISTGGGLTSIMLSKSVASGEFDEAEIEIAGGPLTQQAIVFFPDSLNPTHVKIPLPGFFDFFVPLTGEGTITAKNGVTGETLGEFDFVNGAILRGEIPEATVAVPALSVLGSALLVLLLAGLALLVIFAKGRISKSAARN